MNEKRVLNQYDRLHKEVHGESIFILILDFKYLVKNLSK